MPTSSFTGLNSSAFRPSSLKPFLSINFSGFSFLLYFLQFRFFFFKQLCNAIRQTARVGFLLDFLNCLHGEFFICRSFPSDQDNAVNTQNYLATGFLLNGRNHRTLPANYPRNLRWRYPHDLPTSDFAQTWLAHRELRIMGSG